MILRLDDSDVHWNVGVIFHFLALFPLRCGVRFIVGSASQLICRHLQRLFPTFGRNKSSRSREMVVWIAVVWSFLDFKECYHT